MAKYRYKASCSCEDVEFTIVYIADEPKDEFYCPFCGSMIEDDFEDEDEDLYE